MTTKKTTHKPKAVAAWEAAQSGDLAAIEKTGRLQAQAIEVVLRKAAEAGIELGADVYGPARLSVHLQTKTRPTIGAQIAAQEARVEAAKRADQAAMRDAILAAGEVHPSKVEMPEPTAPAEQAVLERLQSQSRAAGEAVRACHVEISEGLRAPKIEDMLRKAWEKVHPEVTDGMTVGEHAQALAVAELVAEAVADIYLLHKANAGMTPRERSAVMAAFKARPVEMPTLAEVRKTTRAAEIERDRKHAEAEERRNAERAYDRLTAAQAAQARNPQKVDA